MKKSLFLFLAFTSIFFSCKTTKKNTVTAVPVIDTVNDFSFKKLTRDKELYNATTEVVPLDTVYLSKDTLHILTKNILACDADNFQLMWNGMMMKSLPPRTNVKLFQRLDTQCKEKHHFHLTYNITPLQMRRDSSYTKSDTTGRSVIVHLGNWQRTLNYSYHRED